MMRGQSPGDSDCPVWIKAWREPTHSPRANSKSLASETLAHLDTNRPWAIGYLAGRLSIGCADK